LEQGPIADFESLSAAAGLRSLATAVPDPTLFQPEELIAQIAHLRSASAWTFYYAPPAGVAELRHALTDLVRADGISADESSLLVTLGATHALALLIDEVCAPGDTVLVEEPGFLGLEDFFSSRGLLVRHVPSGPGGIDVDALHRHTTKEVRAVVTWPSFGPATGALASDETRQALVELAERRRIHVIEDAHYRRIAFSSQPPPLRALSPCTYVVHIDALSGCLAPGLRTGWICADATLITRLERRVRAGGVAGLGFVQTAVAAYISAGHLATHLTRTLPRYQARRDALVSALRFEWPDGARWTTPKGGLSAWIVLPADRSYERLYEEALGEGVPFAPGPLFGMPDNTLRLSYGALRPEAVLEAATLLGRLVKQRIPR
jgi:DNA-binding transcriptional MocR family regulator